MRLAALLESWIPGTPRQFIPDSEWVGQLVSHIGGLIDSRVNHVQLWLDSNLRRFQGGHAAIEDLRRRFDTSVIEMKANVLLCRAQCSSCHLLCILSRLHDGDHGCQTSHECAHPCEFCKDSTESCGLACALSLFPLLSAEHSVVPDIPGSTCTLVCILDLFNFSSAYSCVVSAHLCGERCKLSGKRGCLEDCTKVGRSDSISGLYHTITGYRTRL